MRVPVEVLPPGTRPPVLDQNPPALQALVDQQVHPVKIAVLEAFRWVGGPLSARELWRIGLGEPGYPNVAYHVKALSELGFIEVTHESPTRGVVEKFYAVKIGS